MRGKALYYDLKYLDYPGEGNFDPTMLRRYLLSTNAPFCNL